MESQRVSALVNNEATVGEASLAFQPDVSANGESHTQWLRKPPTAFKHPHRFSKHRGCSGRMKLLPSSHGWTLKAVAVLLVLVLTKYYISRYVKCLRRFSTLDGGMLLTAGKDATSASNTIRRLAVGESNVNIVDTCAGGSAPMESPAATCQQEQRDLIRTMMHRLSVEDYSEAPTAPKKQSRLKPWSWMRNGGTLLSDFVTVTVFGLTTVFLVMLGMVMTNIYTNDALVFIFVVLLVSNLVTGAIVVSRLNLREGCCPPRGSKSREYLIWMGPQEGGRNLEESTDPHVGRVRREQDKKGNRHSWSEHLLFVETVT